MPQNLAFTPNKQKSASMPQNKIWLRCHKIFGFHATKPKLGFHATKIGSHAKNRLPCHKQNFWLLCHQNSAFTPSKIRLSSHRKTRLFATNLAFMPKNNHLTKDFHKMTTFWSNFQTNHSHSIFAYVFIKSEFKWNKGIQKKKSAKNVYTWRYQKKRRKSLLQIRRLVRHGLQP